MTTLYKVSESLANRTDGRVMRLATVALRIAYCDLSASSTPGGTFMAMRAEMNVAGVS